MKRTVKVKLDETILHDRVAIIRCCGKTKMFNKDDFEPGYMWHCIDCNKLLLVTDLDGIPHYAGTPVFKKSK